MLDFEAAIGQPPETSGTHDLPWFHSSAPVLAAQPQFRIHGCNATSVDGAVAVQRAAT